MKIQFWRIVSITILIIHILYTFINYSTLPQIIPTHFNAAGEADAWGSKNSIWFLPCLNILIFAMFLLLSLWLGKGSLQDKWGLNIPEDWKEDPTGKIQKLVVKTMEAFNIYTTLLLFFVTFCTVFAARGNDSQLLIIMISVLSIFPPLVILGILITKGAAIQRNYAT